MNVCKTSCMKYNKKVMKPEKPIKLKSPRIFDFRRILQGLKCLCNYNAIVFIS